MMSSSSTTHHNSKRNSKSNIDTMSWLCQQEIKFHPKHRRENGSWISLNLEMSKQHCNPAKKQNFCYSSYISCLCLLHHSVKIGFSLPFHSSSRCIKKSCLCIFKLTSTLEYRPYDTKSKAYCPFS